ncbi:MAG: Rne/Rng family ribonuclease [Planctomycetes bacterium]|nr:Rne/Rng family ribonuclease [Planctomycetota bacterium]
MGKRDQLILVNATDPEEKRVAVVENGQIVDFQMTVRTENSVVNDIYRGRVVNLEPAIGAAFVDFGEGRNGFLHTSDVLSVYGDPNWNLERLLTTRIDPQEWDSNSSQPKVGEELDTGEAGAEAPEKPRRKERGREGRSFRARPRLPITDLLQKGQSVCVQVTKDAIGDKGPTLTTYISIPGRYLVLMPSMSRTGVSRKIEDEKERRRLKRILEQMDVPQGMGVIVRTAGIGRTKADLQRDLDYLMGVWETFGKRLRAGHGPAPLYQESDVAIRTVRDLSTPQTEAIIVDDVEVHRQILEFAHKLMPEDEARVKLHTGPKPLFHSYAIEPDFERMFARRIDLPSGGSIVFDQAEALVAIDVNSGRTRTDGFDFEQIALKTNLEAAPVIARQIRLRDLGGIIVVDFIDMMRSGNMRLVERSFREALAQDRARFKIGRISQFGLLELTRQRLGPGIDKKVFHTCSRCRGTGHIRTVESRAAAILRRLGSALTLKGFSTVEVRAHPEVVDYLKSQCMEYLRALEYRCERQIHLIEATDQVEDSVLRYLRTDGREVRPGGRRKR